LYDDLKADLITMLSRTTALQSIHITFSFYPDRIYPEMLDTFRAAELPKLDTLSLHTMALQLFTRRELAIWGAQGGWDRLVTLVLNYAEHLISFIGRMPKLTTLTLHPRHRGDYDMLQGYLNSVNLEAPFRSLSSFIYRGQTTFRSWTPIQDRRLVPWCVLKQAPLIRKLDIARVGFIGTVAGADLDVPYASEIAGIRSLCPMLNSLSIDVVLDGPYAEWPFDVLTELAEFPESLKLMLFLHRQDCKRAWFMTNIYEIIAVVRHIRSQREDLNLPMQLPFELRFKTVRDSARYPKNFNSPDFTVHMHSKLNTEWCCKYMYWSQKEIVLDEMSLEDLKAKTEGSIVRKLGWNYRRYKREIKIADFAADATRLVSKPASQPGASGWLAGLIG
jgi:hypothetical protein